MYEEYNKYALMFKALSDSNRLSIINYLVGQERCACEVLEQLQITQSTLSYHMKILSDINIVSARKEGKWMYYSLNQDTLHELEHLLNTFGNIAENSTLPKKCTN